MRGRLGRGFLVFLLSLRSSRCFSRCSAYLHELDLVCGGLVVRVLGGLRFSQHVCVFGEMVDLRGLI